MEELCEKKGVKIKSRFGEAPTHPHMPYHDGYKVTLRYQKRQLTVPFYMGPAIGREPTAADVISCLISDAFAYENARDIDDFARDFGYERVSETLAAYEACKKTSPRIRHLLGDDFEEFTKAEY
jgi:hypothetical protein